MPSHVVTGMYPSLASALQSGLYPLLPACLLCRLPRPFEVLLHPAVGLGIETKVA